MRILELTDLYSPFIGGLERHVQRLSRTMATQGHDVAIYTAAIPGTPTFEVDEGVEVHRGAGLYQRALHRFYEEDGRPLHATAPDPMVVAQLWRLLRDFRPDVVHAHSWNVYSALAVPRGARVPIVATAHDYGLVCPIKTLQYMDEVICDGPSRRCLPCARHHYGAVKGTALATGTFASRRLLRRVDRFTAVSRYVAQAIEGPIREATGEGVDVLHSFVADGLYELGWEGPRPDFLPADDGYLLYVGALSKHKGLFTLLDAYRHLPVSVPLVLLGQPHSTTPRPEELPSGVTMTTNVPHAAVMAAMVRAGVLVVPSLWPDPLPTTVSEGQLCGVPIVASDVGGIPEQIVEGVTGLLFEPGNAGELTRHLAGLLADEPRRRAMGSRGRENGRRFQASTAASTHIELLEEVARSWVKLA